MAMTKDGKHKSSKFRAARADREHAKDSESQAPKGESEMEQGRESSGGGNRAMANRMMARKEGNPESRGLDDGESMAEEHAEEVVHPGIHDEVKGIVAEHGPAHTIHMTHDHEGMRSHVHSVHADGHEHHADHDGESHHVNAHQHAMHAAGVPVPEEHEPESEQAREAGGEGEESYGEPL